MKTIQTVSSSFDERLVPGGQIDDAQAAVAERRLPVDEQPRVVRPAMRDDVAHARHALAVVGVQPVGGDDAGDSAHVYMASVIARAAGAQAAGPCRGFGDACRRSGVAVAPAGRAVDELPEPELEHHELPEPVTMVGAAAAVLVPEPRRLRALEDAAIAEPAVEQQLGVIGASGPRSHSPIGASKPRLPRSRIARGTRRSRTRRSRYLLRPFFSFSDDRHPRGELEQLVIEQRLARLERDRHAHPIDLGQDVVDHVGARVDVERAIHRIERRAGAIGVAEAGERVGVAAPRAAKSRE